MTEVQLVVKHVRLDVTINLNVTLGPGEGAEAGSPEAAQARPTAAACVSSIAALASNDPDPTLSQEDRANLQFTTTDGDEEARQGASYGTVYGEVIREFADHLQQQVDEFTDGIVDEDPAQAVASLENELDDVFDVTEGQGRFSSGRVMAAFYLTYSLVKKYYQRYGTERLLPFMKQLLPSLVSYLFRIGFITWLVITGGWVILRAMTRADSMVSFLFRLGGVVPVAVGVIWCCWKVYRYFRP